MSAIDPPEKNSHGCFFNGCIVLLVFLVLAAAAAALFGIHYALKVTNAKIVKYTETQPMVFPKVDMPARDLNLLEGRAQTFYNSMTAHTSTPPLVLTSEDLNVLIANNTNFQEFKGMYYVNLEGEQVEGKMSLQLDKFFRFPFVHFKGRYLNGTGTFKVAVSNGMPSIYIQSLKVKGEPLPPELMAQLRGRDLVADFISNSTNVIIPSRYESIEVKDGKMTVKAKNN